MEERTSFERGSLDFYFHNVPQCSRSLGTLSRLTTAPPPQPRKIGSNPRCKKASHGMSYGVACLRETRIYGNSSDVQRIVLPIISLNLRDPTCQTCSNNEAAGPNQKRSDTSCSVYTVTRGLGLLSPRPSRLSPLFFACDVIQRLFMVPLSSEIDSTTLQ